MDIVTVITAALLALRSLGDVTYEDFIGRFEKRTATARGAMVRCPAHEDGKASLSVGLARDGGVVLKCFAGCPTESVVKSLGLEMKDLFAEEKAKAFVPRYKPMPVSRNGHGAPKVKPVVEKTYSYTDALGRELYQVVRLKPKDFRQRHAADGSWVWNMDGVERVLYRLPEVLKSEEVWVVEGEKDADNLASLGFCATTNVGGAGKWLDGYSQALAGKDVVLCGDSDDSGQKHVEAVFDSVAAKARSVRVVKLAGHKDVSLLVESLPVERPARKVLEELRDDCVPHVGGVRMPVYSMAEIEPRYHRVATQPDTLQVNLSKWLPTLRVLRPVVPGNFVLFVGDTGTGKTILLQNVFANFAHLPTLFFEMELTQEELYERFWANKAKLTGREVEDEYRRVGTFGSKAVMSQFPNLFICPEPRLTVENFEQIIVKAELKMGQKPVLVLADYMQLFKASRRYSSRYEKSSDVAEEVKLIAKATGTIIVGASQVDRASGKEGEVGLHSAKDSGSWESSASHLFGVKRDAKDPTLLWLQVLKASKGGAGTKVACNIDGARATITERASQEEQE